MCLLIIQKIQLSTYFKGDGSGYEDGLVLPDGISRFITPEFLEITFFDLELTESLYRADRQQTDKIIKKLCKLDYLDEISKSLEAFIKNFRKNQGKLKDSQLEKNEQTLEKIIKHHEKIIEKLKTKDKKSNLKKIKDIEKNGRN